MTAGMVLPPACVRYNFGYTSGMKTAISIPDKLFHAADELASTLQLSRSALYSAAIAEYLKAKTGERITARLDAVYRAVEGSPTTAQPRVSRADHW